MTKENDSDELARRFLDLWQDQAQAVAADLSAQGGWSKVMRDFGIPADSMGTPDSFADNVAAQWAAWPAMMAAATVAKTAGTEPEDPAGSAEGSQDENEGRREHAPGRTSPSGTKTAATSSGDGLHDLDQLLCRIDALEKRLAALESKKPRRRQSKKTKDS